jgi:hypothetical protein
MSSPPAPETHPAQKFANAPSARSAAPSARSAAEATPPPLLAASLAAPEPVRESAVVAEPAPGAESAEVRYTTPLLDDDALAHDIRSACESARRTHRLVLLEFSAPWCSDCLALEKLKHRDPLAAELARWELLAVNVGGGDAHPDLMRAFRVNQIAKLVALAPNDCAMKIANWPVRAARTLDGLGKRSADPSNELTRWLTGLREPRPRR